MPKLPNIKDLTIKQLATLIDQAGELIETKREDAKEELMAKMRQHAEDAGIDINELLGGRPRATHKRRGEPMYRGPNGETATGKGPPPKWLRELEAKGHKRSKYLIAK